MTDLKDQYTLKSDVYPRDITAALSLLENYSTKPSVRRDEKKQQATEGLQFAQRSEPIAGRNGKLFQNVECYKCNRKGHYANQCPTVGKDGVQLMMINGTEVTPTEEEEDKLGFNFMQQQDTTSLPNTSVLIDTGSNVLVFKNKQALRNITQSNSGVRAHTNGGYQDSTLQGYLPGFFKVWYNPRCMVNILAWSDIRKKV